MQAVRPIDVALLPHQVAVFAWPDAVTSHVTYVKGRRAGGTHGAAKTCIKWALKSPLGRPLRQLWVDMSTRNITRYQNRYFIPCLRPLPRGTWNLNRQEETLTMVDGAIVDFLSHEQGSRGEGFAYDVMWVNEAGHVYKDADFYNQVLLPMAIEGDGCKIFSIGAPKGRNYLFQELFERGERGEPGYVSFRHTSFDNSLLSRELIERYTRHMPTWQRRQEVYGEFAASGEQIFKREWFPIFAGQPVAGMTRIRFWDMASTEVRIKAGRESDPDWTSGARCAVDPDARIWIEDVRRFRVGPAEVKNRIVATAVQDGPGVIVWIEQEPGASGAIVIEDLRRELAAVGIICKGIRPTGPKPARAAPLAGYAESGRVKMLQAAWNADFISEVEAFPKGKHDDMVDSVSGAFMQLAPALAGDGHGFAVDRQVTDWGI